MRRSKITAIWEYFVLLRWPYYVGIIFCIGIIVQEFINLGILLLISAY